MIRPYTTIKTNGHEEWLATRRTGIGSSDVAAVCNLSSWGTPASVFAEKVWGIRKEENDQMRIGNLLEPKVAEIYEQVNGVTLDRIDTLRSVDRPWQIANLDRVNRDGDKRPVEIKVSGWAGGWGIPGTDDIPTQYFLQTQHQMDVYGSDVIDLAALVGGTDFREYEIRYQDSVVKRMRQACADFWGMVERCELPPIDFRHPSTRELVELLCVPEDSAVVDAQVLPKLVEKSDRYVELQSAIKDLEKQKEAIRNEIEFLMGNSSLVSLPNGRHIKRKLVTRKGYQVEQNSYFSFNIK